MDTGIAIICLGLQIFLAIMLASREVVIALESIAERLSDINDEMRRRGP